MQSCMSKLQGSSGGTQTAPGGFNGGGFLAGGANSAPFATCLPASLRKLRARFTSPSETLRQVLNPPQTNISTSAYTIGGVDQTQPKMGVVTKAQVVKGRYLAAAGGKEALVSQAYATKHSLKAGST